MGLKKVAEKIKFIFVPIAANNYRPKFLESRCLMFCLVILFVLKLSALPFFVYFPKSSFFGAVVKSVLVDLLNKERKALGLQSLTPNSVLEQAAFLKARDIFEKNYFSHYGPQGTSPWYWFKTVGYNYKYAGENLAIGFIDSYEVHRAWMNSSSHRANLLNPNYKDVGIAVLKGVFQGNETTVVVQLFGSPQKITSKPKVATKNKIEPSPISTKTPEPVEKKQVSPTPQITEEPKIFGELTPSQCPSPIAPISQESAAVTSTPERKSFILTTPITELVDKGSFFAKEVSEKATFKFFSFLASDYFSLLQILSYGLLGLIILALIINIFVKIKIQYLDLILKTLGFIAVLTFFILLDQQVITGLIPRDFDFRINTVEEFKETF